MNALWEVRKKRISFILLLRRAGITEQISRLNLIFKVPSQVPGFGANPRPLLDILDLVSC